MVVTGCWANVSPPGACHHEHTHPDNFPSGVDYVKASVGGDTIDFHDPWPQAHVMAPRTTKLSTKHAASFNINAKVGRMVLFPAWLAHSVDIKRAQE